MGGRRLSFIKNIICFFLRDRTCYIPVYIPSREAYMISIGSNVWITHGTSLVTHDASVQVGR